MGSVERWVQVDRVLRPWLVRLPAPAAVALYSLGRRRFLRQLFAAQVPPEARWVPPAALGRTLWGLHFRVPLGNGAGLFKNAEGYSLTAAQGAGWYLAGTTTGRPWAGNRWGLRGLGVAQPFAPYPRSAAASNWLGLPNAGTAAVARRLETTLREGRVEGMPVGASVAATPGLGEGEALEELVAGMEMYAAAGVDFLEINESCPNTGEGRPQDSGLARRLEFLGDRFLRRRERPLPVIAKLSCDTPLDQLPDLLALLVATGFDGLNFGNTSRDYAGVRPELDPRERRLYDFFTRRFGGGVSGRPLRPRSLELVRAAAEILQAQPPAQEFHVIRTGGVESAADVAASLAAGASLCGWYTGYFEALSHHGHGLYRALLEDLPGA